MTSLQEAPTTLPVTHLALATHFYQSALRPLGYGVVSRVRHETTHASSEAVGIGPQSSQRVDLFLSQSSLSAKENAGGRTAHVVFPATSRHAVRDFYAAALEAGGRPVFAPDNLASSPGVFYATVADIDGNKVQVTFPGQAEQDDMPNPSYRTRHIINLDLDKDATVEVRNPSKTTTRVYPVAKYRSSVPPEDRYVESRKIEVRPSTKDAGDANPIVGTLLGAAAGAAITYALVKETADSKAREAEFNARMDARDRVKEEARQHFEAVESKPRRRRNSFQSPDSGYNSGASPPGGGEQNYTVTYPKSGTSGPRRSSSLREPRRLENAPASLKHSNTMPIRSIRSSARSPARSANTANTPSMPPGPPPPPSGRSRSVRERTERSDRYSSYGGSRKSSSTVRPPTASGSKSGSKPPSRSGQSRTSRKAPSTTRTARQVPLPPSSKATSYRTSPENIPLPSSKANTNYDDDSDSMVDELETVFPDDSISCAPTAPPISERSGGRKTLFKAPSRTSRSTRKSGSRKGTQIAVN